MFNVQHNHGQERVSKERGGGACVCECECVWVCVCARVCVCVCECVFVHFFSLEKDIHQEGWKVDTELCCPPPLCWCNSLQQILKSLAVKWNLFLCVSPFLYFSFLSHTFTISIFFVFLFSHSTSLHNSLNISQFLMPLSFLSFPSFPFTLSSFSFPTLHTVRLLIYVLSSFLPGKRLYTLVEPWYQKVGRSWVWIPLAFNILLSISIFLQDQVLVICYFPSKVLFFSFLLTSPSIQHLEISRRHIFCSSFLSISFFQRRSQERKTTRRRVSKIHCRTKKRLFLAWMVNPSFSFSTQVTHLFRFFFCTELFLWLLNEVWNVGKKKKVDSENIFYDHLSQIFGQRL